MNVTFRSSCAPSSIVSSGGGSPDLLMSVLYVACLRSVQFREQQQQQQQAGGMRRVNTGGASTPPPPAAHDRRGGLTSCDLRSMTLI